MPRLAAGQGGTEVQVAAENKVLRQETARTKVTNGFGEANAIIEID
jgi:hypothetical protein